MEIKVSQLPAAIASDDADQYMVIQVGTNRRQTMTQLKAALGVESDNLAALNALTGAADRVIYFTGPGAMAVAVMTAFARSLLEKTDAGGVRTALSVQPTASPVFTGPVQAEQFILNGVAAPSIFKSLVFKTSGAERIALNVSGAESTGNAGSDFIMTRTSDAGAFLGRLISATRSTGNVSIGNAAADATAQLLVNGPLWATGPVKPGQYLLSTLPSAATYNGYEIDVTNATGGSKRCRSNGTVWQILNTTTTVS